MHHPNAPSIARRSRRAIIAALVVALTAGTTALASPAGAAEDPPLPAAVGRSCAPDSGVSVVVDFRELGGDITVGCAPGQQANGFAALANAGFSVNDAAGIPASILCQIDGKPAAGYPTCWYEGYWSYWRSDGSAPWGFSPTGASAGPLPVGTVEGWTWDAPGGGAAGAPALTIEEVGALALPAATCDASPQIPTFDIIDDDETLPVSIADDRPVEVAVVPAGAEPAPTDWAAAEEVALDGQRGPTRVLARVAGAECPDRPLFDATYDVRPTYAPRWNGAGDGSPSPAIDRVSPELVAFATGHSEYVPGTNVNESFRVPANAYGAITSSVVVLGDGGTITMTFDAPITDGPGYDLAVFENGFAFGAGDYLELAYLEVSSDGTTFERFDSASRRATPVGAFEAQQPEELGGLPGKDLASKGTPFDLSLLANRPAVRNGSVDLARITHIRLVDIVGDGSALDSFGRPIYDPHPVTGSAGFDLAGIGVRNELDVVAPVLTITDVPSSTISTSSAVVAWTVDDETASVEASLDGAPFAPATSPLTLTDLANGAHELRLRATDPTGNATTEVITWTVAVPTPLSADGSWAMAVSEDLLDALPTAEERLAIEGRLAAGTTRRTVANELARSEAWTKAVVTRFYAGTLERQPDPSGLAYWSGQLSSGRRTVAQVAAQFYGSSEYHRRLGGGTDTGWITDLYAKLLGRAPDPAGLSYWVRRAATTSRASIAATFYDSPESRRARVRGLYDHLLQRSPDPSGLRFWSDRIRRTGDIALAVELVTSAEYGRRAAVRHPVIAPGA